MIYFSCAQQISAFRHIESALIFQDVKADNSAARADLNPITPLGTMYRL